MVHQVVPEITVRTSCFQKNRRSVVSRPANQRLMAIRRDLYIGLYHPVVFDPLVRRQGNPPGFLQAQQQIPRCKPLVTSIGLPPFSTFTQGPRKVTAPTAILIINRLLNGRNVARRSTRERGNEKDRIHAGPAYTYSVSDASGIFQTAKVTQTRRFMSMALFTAEGPLPATFGY